MENKHKLELFFNKPNILETITNKSLKWDGHAWRRRNHWLRTILEEDPAGKRPLGRPHMRWEDLIKKDVSALDGESDWWNEHQTVMDGGMGV